MYFPFMIELSDKPVTVIGGGTVALRKCQLMLEFGAAVTVISPDLCEGFSALSGRICHLAARYSPNCIQGSSIVIAATDDNAVNSAIAADCRACGIPVNAVDSPADCSFIVPSVLHRGSLVISISTGGKCPALARSIRRELDARFDDSFEERLELLCQLREKLKQTVPSQPERSAILTRACKLEPEELRKQLEQQAQTNL